MAGTRATTSRPPTTLASWSSMRTSSVSLAHADVWGLGGTRGRRLVPELAAAPEQRARAGRAGHLSQCTCEPTSPDRELLPPNLHPLSRNIRRHHIAFASGLTTENPHFALRRRAASAGRPFPRERSSRWWLGLWSYCDRTVSCRRWGAGPHGVVWGIWGGVCCPVVGSVVGSRNLPVWRCVGVVVPSHRG